MKRNLVNMAIMRVSSLKEQRDWLYNNRFELIRNTVYMLNPISKYAILSLEELGLTVRLI